MTESPGLGIQANFGADFILALGSVKEEIRRQRIEQAEYAKQRHLASISNNIPLTQSVTSGATGFCSADLGTPSVGRVWTIRQIMASVQGSELSANVAATIGWYVGTNVFFNSATPSLQATFQWRASMTGVPSYTTYTSDIIQVKAGEHLFVIQTTGPATANMVYTAIVKDEPVKAGIPTAPST